MTTATEKARIVDATRDGKSRKKWAFKVSYHLSGDFNQRVAAGLFQYKGEAWIFAQALRDHGGLLDSDAVIWVELNRE